MPVKLALVVPDVERELLGFADELATAHDLASALRVVTTGVTRLLDTDHASVRLLDDARTNLLLAARTGRSLVPGSDAPFVVGEGLVGWIVANGVPLRVGAATDDPRFAERSGGSALASFLGVPLSDDRGPFGVLAVSSRDRDAFDEGDEARLRLIAALAAPPLQIHRLRRIAETDSLTGLLNRHALEHVLPEQGDAGVSVVMFDVDHFKDVNDRHGHAVGDEVLVEIARAIRAAMRIEDHAVRWGGEEFLLVLPGVPLQHALETAERIRASVARSIAARGDRITISGGVAVRREGEARDALVARADTALYEAKHLGRDRTVAAEN